MEEHRDRLSELPDSLIHLIFSFLSMRDVISTTILSKRWHSLWTTVPCLNFCDDNYSKLVNGDDSVRNFVNRALMFWRGTKILKFKFEFEYLFDLSLAVDFDLWVRFAVDYKVEDLSIDLTYSDNIMKWDNASTIKDVYCVPQCVYSCSSIKKLSLRGCNLRMHGSPAWNQLEGLKFNGFHFTDSFANQILLGSPRLEVFELSFFDGFEDLNIQSASLKKLRIKKYSNMVDVPPPNLLLRISCPNLETLKISGALYDKYFLSNVSSLIDVNLGFYDWRYENVDAYVYDDDEDDIYGFECLGEKFRQILPAIQHVQNLALSSSWCVKGFVELLKKYLLSPFPNVKFLKLEFDDIELGDMVNLLGIFPNLKMLLIKSYPTYDPEFNVEHLLEFEFSLSNSVLLQLKTIHVTSALTNSKIFRVIAFLLKHASMLEKLVIGVEGGSEAFHSKATKVLLNMPRSSSTAKENIPIDEVFKNLRCTREGLTTAAAEERLTIFGHNKLEEKKVLIF